MVATFELKHNDDRQYIFQFLDNHGELLLMSGEYPSKQAAEQAQARDACTRPSPRPATS